MPDKTRPVSFAIVAGEASGDILGAGLIRALRDKYPDAYFYGIGGTEMIKEGFHSLFPMERLSVMGLVEVLGRIFELVSIRKFLIRHIIKQRPAAFIGIDAPDFNIGLEYRLKKAGITTFHYVSPSIWAWRQRRILKIRKAVDHMLVFMPFELEFYQKHNVPATFTGHPLADTIPMDTDTELEKKKLGFPSSTTLVALLPGSREQEIRRLGPLFFKAARIMRESFHNLSFIIPCANANRMKQVNEISTEYPDINVKITMGNSHEAMAASDALLLASGTTTLEGMLYGKPMVVSYKLSWLTWKIAQWLVKTPWCALPNILAGKCIVPELLQEQATPHALAKAMEQLLKNKSAMDDTRKIFRQWHKTLKQNASERAANAIENTLRKKSL